MKTTIADIAKLASVHPATVSRVLNNRRGVIHISEQTRKKVMDAAAALNFYPNYAAQSLAMASPRTIGVCVHLSDEYGGGAINDYKGEIISGIEEYAYKAGFDILLLGLNSTEEDLDRCKQKLCQKRVDGLILISDKERSHFISGLLDINKNVIAIDAYESDIKTLTINIDNVKASKLAMRYLFSMGHRKVGFIGALHNPEGVEESFRRQGYSDSLVEAGLTYGNAFVVNGSNCSTIVSREDNCCFLDGVAGITDLLSRDKDVTAVLCINDQVAAGVLNTLADMRKSVPNDFSVIGFDDSAITRYTYPALTSVRHNLRKMGIEAATSLVLAARSQIEICKDIRFVDTELVIRKSTGPVKL